jgi:3-oxoacyl-[acyl-carrier-protein] synthase-3
MTDATVTESPDFDVPDHVPAELVRVFDHFNEPGLKANPVTFYDEIRRGDHPTFWSPVFGGFWVLTRFDDIKTVLAKKGITPDEVKYFLLHQANVRILDAIRHDMELTEEKFPYNINDHGNTSSASIPMLLDELNKAGKINEGDYLVLSAFGAGFTSGACLLKW